MASTVWQMTVCDALNAMRKAGTLCDTTIVGVDGTMLYAHACVLTAASPRIATYFKRTADSRYHLDIDWISGASWELLLKLLYCGAIDVDREEEIEHVRELTESFAIGILETTITHPQIKVEVIKRCRCSGEIDQKNVHIDAYNNNDKNLDREKELLDFEKTNFDYSSQSGATLTDTTRFSRASITQTSYRSNVNNFQSNGKWWRRVLMSRRGAGFMRRLSIPSAWIDIILTYLYDQFYLRRLMNPATGVLSHLVCNTWQILTFKRTGLCPIGVFAWTCYGYVMLVIVSRINPLCYCPGKIGDFITVIGGVDGF